MQKARLYSRAFVFSLFHANFRRLFLTVGGAGMQIEQKTPPPERWRVPLIDATARRLILQTPVADLPLRPTLFRRPRKCWEFGFQHLTWFGRSRRYTFVFVCSQQRQPDRVIAHKTAWRNLRTHFAKVFNNVKKEWMKKSKIYEIFNFAITTGTIYMSNRGYYSFRTSAGNRVRRGRKKINSNGKVKELS